jgi:hypothetical protein
LPDLIDAVFVLEQPTNDKKSTVAKPENIADDTNLCFIVNRTFFQGL